MREWKPRPDTGDLGRGFRQRRAKEAWRRRRICFTAPLPRAVRDDRRALTECRRAKRPALKGQSAASPRQGSLSISPGSTLGGRALQAAMTSIHTYEGWWDLSLIDDRNERALHAAFVAVIAAWGTTFLFALF